MTDYFKRYGQTEINGYRHGMFRQEMEPYSFIIGACVHNMTTSNKVKTPDDECGSRLAHKSTCRCQWGSWFQFRVTH